MYLILYQFGFILGIALEDVVAAILSNTFLYYFISAIFDDLDLFVFTLYHQYNINIKKECLRLKFIYLLASLERARLLSSGTCSQGRRRRDMQLYRINLQRGRWGSSNLSLWIRVGHLLVAFLSYRMGVSAVVRSSCIIIQRWPYRSCIIHHQQYGGA